MSNESNVKVSPEEALKDEQFLEHRATVRKKRYIKRHGIQARITHDVTAICCVWLCISGLFVFVPPLAEWAGADTVFAFRMSHRVIGVIFVLVPLISALTAPKGFMHMMKTMFAKWDSDDKKWMILFLPYLFMARWIHMPDQGETKSGQKFADGMMVLLGVIMAISGVILLIGEIWIPLPVGLHGVMLFIHDLGFLGFAIFASAHIFLGAGIFQPYRGTIKLMFGDGYVKESDALYHWGHWARKELKEGKNVIEKDQ